MNEQSDTGILISANTNMVEVDDAVKHLANHKELYWEVGFRINEDQFSYPIVAFIHISQGQVEYRAKISAIVPFSRDHYESPSAEQVKPTPWRMEWKHNVNGIRTRNWKYALVITEIVPFSYDTHLLLKLDGTPVRHAPQSFVRVFLPTHSGKPNVGVSHVKPGKTLILEKNLQNFLRDHPDVIETGLSFEQEELVTNAGRIDLLFRDKKGNYVVVELKRTLGTDQVVGQILRYMGCLAEKHGSDKVRGVIVVGTKDSALSYAAMAVPNLQVKEYKFHIE